MSDQDEEIIGLEELKGYYRRLINDYGELLVNVQTLKAILQEAGVFSHEQFEAVFAKVLALGAEGREAARSQYESRREKLRAHESDPQ